MPILTLTLLSFPPSPHLEAGAEVYFTHSTGRGSMGRRRGYVCWLMIVCRQHEIYNNYITVISCTLD